MSETVIIKKTNNMYKCTNCCKSYKLKENYEKHKSACDLFHIIQSKTHDEITDISEEIPTQKEMYKLLKELALKCGNLEKEVSQLKAVVNIRQKKQILECLNNQNSETKKPKITFTQWYKTWEVTVDDLFKVFEDDLSEGFKNVINRQISIFQEIKPLCAFTNKPNYIYMFEQETETNLIQWLPLSSEIFNEMFMYITRKFFQVFIKWQNENREKIESSEAEKDTIIMYMIKLNGSKVPTEKRELEIKKWLYSVIEQKSDILYEFI